MSVWYLAFCDDEKPEGQQFLGACFVETDGGVEDAVREAWHQ
jgi:hypothetical protein